MSKSIQKVIELIQKYMDEETLIWHKPFLTASQANFASKHEYQGINRFTTALVSHHVGYQSPYWMTFNQIRELEGELKGAKGLGVPILFYRRLDSEDSECVDEKKRRFVLSHSTVFNLDLVDGIDAPLIENDASVVKDAAADKVISDYLSRTGIPVLKGSPCYRPKADEVCIPQEGMFTSSGEYYSTFFHELAHSTGHEKRLARFKTNAGAFASKVDYSKEEMVAEYTSALLCQECGVNDEAVVKNQAAYIQGWNNYILKNGHEFVSAVSQAYKARDFLHGKTPVAL